MSNLKWIIGDVDITQIVEMEDNKLFSTFIPEAKPEIIRKIKWLNPFFADGIGKLRAQVQSFLVKSNHKNILVDTCNGNSKERPNMPTWSNLKTDYLKRLKDDGVAPESIDIVVCTHLHFDHVGWNTKRENGKWVPTFPNAKYLISKEEYSYWIKKPEKEMIDDLNGFDDSVNPIVQAGLQLVPDDYRVDSNVRFIPTPGHTPHHMSVVIESQNKKAIISGDVIHHPCQIAYPDWTTLADTYPDQTVESRKKLLNEIQDTDTLLIGSHFSNPVAGKVIKKENDYIFKV